jgi:hypothetical protein
MPFEELKYRTSICSKINNLFFFWLPHWITGRKPEQNFIKVGGKGVIYFETQSESVS